MHREVVMADIFLSYSRRDLDCARLLAEALEARGWTVWWDRHIPHGRDFSTHIQQQLDSAGCIVVLWSTASLGSKFVRDEAAEGLGGRLVPVLLEPVKQPLGFRQVLAANLIGWHGGTHNEEFEKLVSSIGAIVPPRPPATDESRNAIPNRATAISQPHKPVISEPPKGAVKRSVSAPNAIMVICIIILVASGVVSVSMAIMKQSRLRLERAGFPITPPARSGFTLKSCSDAVQDETTGEGPTFGVHASGYLSYDVNKQVDIHFDFIDISPLNEAVRRRRIGRIRMGLLRDVFGDNQERVVATPDVPVGDGYRLTDLNVRLSAESLTRVVALYLGIEGGADTYYGGPQAFTWIYLEDPPPAVAMPFQVKNGDAVAAGSVTNKEGQVTIHMDRLRLIDKGLTQRLAAGAEPQLFFTLDNPGVEHITTGGWGPRATITKWEQHSGLIEITNHDICFFLELDNRRGDSYRHPLPDRATLTVFAADSERVSFTVPLRESGL
jgi:hypothetical protein